LLVTRGTPRHLVISSTCQLRLSEAPDPSPSLPLGQGPGTPAGPIRGARIGLYRNDLQVAADLTRAIRFTDVTDASGTRTPGARSYGFGDLVNDGDTDTSSATPTGRRG
jgi:hypothetical protein